MKFEILIKPSKMKFTKDWEAELWLANLVWWAKFRKKRKNESDNINYVN